VVSFSDFANQAGGEQCPGYFSFITSSFYRLEKSTVLNDTGSVPSFLANQVHSGILEYYPRILRQVELTYFRAREKYATEITRETREGWPLLTVLTVET
jgi:hypothetical protein